VPVDRFSLRVLLLSPCFSLLPPQVIPLALPASAASLSCAPRSFLPPYSAAFALLLPPAAASHPPCAPCVSCLPLLCPPTVPPSVFCCFRPASPSCRCKSSPLRSLRQRPPSLVPVDGSSLRILLLSPCFSLLPLQVIPLALPASAASLSCARRPVISLIFHDFLFFFCLHSSFSVNSFVSLLFAALPPFSAGIISRFLFYINHFPSPHPPPFLSNKSTFCSSSRLLRLCMAEQQNSSGAERQQARIPQSLVMFLSQRGTDFAFILQTHLDALDGGGGGGGGLRNPMALSARLS
jgi:hypothetical protein